MKCISHVAHQSVAQKVNQKPASSTQVKCKDYVELLANGAGDILFFRDRDGPPIPTLKQLHKYPFLLKPQQVDKGAIRFILSGANIMCPGLTSPGANMIEAEADEIVAIYAEGS